MDNLTHTLIGVAMARSGLYKRVTGATLTLALASNLPDLDIVSAFWGNVSYLEHHRGITHAFPASPLFAAGLALVLCLWPKSERRFLPTFLAAWIGVGVHIVADLWTSYGTRALLPWDSTWYSWDWIFIIDPVLLLLLAVACFGVRFLPRFGAHRWSMILVLAYIGLRAALHSQALGQARSIAGSDFETVRAFPDPIRLNRWRFLASRDDAFATGYVPAFGIKRTKATFSRVQPDLLARRISAESRAARVFLEFSAFPRFETRQESGLTVLVWRDLRFTDRRADGFFCEVKVDGAGHIVSERVVF